MFQFPTKNNQPTLHHTITRQQTPPEPSVKYTRLSKTLKSRVSQTPEVFHRQYVELRCKIPISISYTFLKSIITSEVSNVNFRALRVVHFSWFLHENICQRKIALSRYIALEILFVSFYINTPLELDCCLGHLSIEEWCIFCKINSPETITINKCVKWHVSECIGKFW